MYSICFAALKSWVEHLVESFSHYARSNAINNLLFFLAILAVSHKSMIGFIIDMPLEV
jgi:hypothetical protein